MLKIELQWVAADKLLKQQKQGTADGLFEECKYVILMLSTLKKERHMVTGLKTTED